jgi:hypothetical protein
MLKTTIEKIAKPNKVLIMWGILSGYIPNPLFFLIRLKFSIIKTKKKLPGILPEDVKEVTSMVIALYLQLRKHLKEANALMLTKAIVLLIGLTSQMSLFRYVEEPDHSFENLIKQAKRFKEESPMRLNKSEIIVQNETRYEFRVKNCIFKGIFEKFDCPELLGIFCAIDNATYNIYSPDKVIFHRGGKNKTIANGDSYCHFICENINH